MAGNNVKDWNDVTHRRTGRIPIRKLGLGVSMACGKVYDDRKPDVDFEAESEVDCMACIAAKSST